jgi:hypothetical protein
VNYSRGGGSQGRRGSGYRSLPVWLQWVIPFAVAAIVVLALVLFVNYETNSVPQIATVTPNAAKEENREDTILVQQQQAPHQAKLAAGQPAAAGLRAAVLAYMTHQINIGSMDGPIKRSSCTPAAGGTSGRLVFNCAVTASVQMVTYPFDGVVQSASGEITYCQRVAPPIPSMNVPVSKRCT